MKGHLEPRQLDYLQKIHDSANSLLRLINDILDFSKIEAGKLDMENRYFSLAEVLEGLSSASHHRHDKRPGKMLGGRYERPHRQAHQSGKSL